MRPKKSEADAEITNMRNAHGSGGRLIENVRLSIVTNQIKRVLFIVGTYRYLIVIRPYYFDYLLFIVGEIEQHRPLPGALARSS